MANFKKNTRYSNGTVDLNRSNKQFLILRKPLKLSFSNTDTTVSITQDIANRPDLISYKAYNDPDLWWVIYEYNNISDPLFGLAIGQTIRIPSLDRLLKAVAKVNI